MEMQKVLLASTIFFFAGLAQAQDAVESTPSSSAQAPNDAVGVHLAPGLRGTAAVGGQVIYNSNFYLTEDNPKSSFGFVLTPSVLLLRESKKLKYEVGAGLEATKYTGVDEGPDSYVDGSISGKLDWAALTRHNFHFDYITRFSHDPFGSIRTENGVPVDQGLDKWIQTAATARYRFGAPGALINLETDLGWMGREYQTNRDQTQLLDFDSWRIRETAFFNVSSKTALLAEVMYNNVSYDVEAANFPSRDYQTTHYRVGMHWIATGTTSGDLRIGKLRRNFDNPAKDSLNALDWNATITWAPLIYSTFTFQTGVQSQQSYLANVQLLQNRFGLIDWTHQFSYYLRSRVIYSRVNSQFIGSNRVDNLDTFAVEANYFLKKRLMTIAGASYSRRDSNEVGRDYGDTSVYLGVRYNR
ncbi:outer membrane beta-barrel protein [Stenotrophobium rhamnosiphilum]|uniref:Outer membrane beta-barrel protein n=1 Tax=Stenotrophobium rhamnosiphilum TaxID=2029166 RepID=A0A2T5MK31_9GAMM|nr:outer membrane beta-barrel protein [Stenotrophobium rhamnosiphilum]PTU32930.1 hypothetical protein CJD38_02115 [Stenotrophobium rhamnosiphilum]